jgi:hypothetical protein
METHYPEVLGKYDGNSFPFSIPCVRIGEILSALAKINECSISL